VQVVAREDKGLLGKDWNKSPPTRFATSPSNPTVRPSNRGGVVLRAFLPATKQQEVIIISMVKIYYKKGCKSNVHSDIRLVAGGRGLQRDVVFLG
jgi:hypothetical protein